MKLNKVSSFLNKNKFQIALFLMAAAVIADPSKSFASTIPTGASGSGIGSAISGVGTKIGGYATDAMYVLFGVAGISLVIAGGSYLFSHEHGKLVKDGLGTGIVTGVLGAVMAAVSHGEAGGSTTGGSTGAMILSHAANTAVYVHAHIAAHLNK
jgi:hypothetical protein